MSTVTQPTGIKAFGWGILGFIGSNIIIGIICEVGLMIGEAYNPDAFWYFAVMAAAVGAAYWFAESREYTATKKGVYVSIFVQVLGFIAGMVGVL